jgi:hypothetical protein
MTPRELRDIYIHKAKEAEKQANHRQVKLREREMIRIESSWNARGIEFDQKKFETEVKVWTSKSCKNDPLYKDYVGENQWYIQQAIMFGNAATEKAIRDLIDIIVALK